MKKQNFEMQKMAAPILDWLFSDNPKDRGTGRSTAIRGALIRKATKNKSEYFGNPTKVHISEGVLPFETQKSTEIPL